MIMLYIQLIYAFGRIEMFNYAEMLLLFSPLLHLLIILFIHAHFIYDMTNIAMHWRVEDRLRN